MTYSNEKTENACQKRRKYHHAEGKLVLTTD